MSTLHGIAAIAASLAATDYVLTGTPVVDLLLKLDGGNGSTTFADTGAHAFALTKNGGIAQSTAQASPISGSASVGLWVGGSGQYLQFNPGTSLDWGVNPDVHISAWIRPNTVSGTDIILERAADANNRWVWYMDNGTVKFTTIVAGAIKFEAAAQLVGPVLATGQWYFVELSRHANRWDLWVDGVLIRSVLDQTATYSSVFGTTVRVGEQAYTTGSALDAYLDEVRIASGQYRRWGSYTRPTVAL